MHALQDSKTVFILMASFTSPPRTLLPISSSQRAPTAVERELARAEDGGSEKPVDDKEKDNDDTPITHSLRFNLPTSGDSFVPRASHDVRPFAPSYQIEFPPDIIPWGRASSEEETWAGFLAAIKDKGIHLGKKKRAVQNYIEERKQSPIEIAIARQQAGKWGTTRAIWIKPRLEENEVLDHNSVRVSTFGLLDESSLRADADAPQALIGFMTDFQFIGTGARSVGLSGTSQPRLGMMVSLSLRPSLRPACIQVCVQVCAQLGSPSLPLSPSPSPH